MYKKIKHILIFIIIIIVGSTAINISSSMDYYTGRVKVDTGLPTIEIYTSLDSSGNRIEIDRDVWTVANINITDSSDNDFDGYTLSTDIQIKGRGHSSWRMAKKGYSIKFDDNEEVLGLNAGKDFALVANYSDKTLMRNAIAYDFASSLYSSDSNDEKESILADTTGDSNKLNDRSNAEVVDGTESIDTENIKENDKSESGFVPSYRYAELYLNDQYLGNYLLLEKVEVDENRLDLNDSDIDNELTGYLLEIDMRSRVAEDEELFFSTKYINEDNILYINEEGELLPTIVSVQHPKPKNITPKQFDYIKNYVLEAEEVLFSEGFSDTEEGYAKYFDVDSFVDWYIINELFKSVDAPMLTSVYMYKTAGGKLEMGPIWDYDISMGVAGYRNNVQTDGYYIGKSPWFERLLEDPAFVEKVSTRWAEIRNNQVEDIFTDMDNRYAYIYKSQKENFKRWNIIGRWVWPEPSDVQPRSSYAEEVNYLIGWLRERVSWFDETFLPEVKDSTAEIDSDLNTELESETNVNFHDVQTTDTN